MNRFLNQIICGDNVEVMRQMPNGCVDLTVTSPPYDNLRTYNGFSFDFESVARELYRITKDGGVVVWVVGDATIKGSETGTSFKQALYFKDIGFNLHDTMIYAKDSCPFPETNRYYPSFEYMFVFSKGKPKVVNLIQDKLNKRYGKPVHASGRQQDGSIKICSAVKNNTGRKVKQYGVRRNIWEYQIGKWKSTKDPDAYQHPAIFPEQLAKDHIISWSNLGDLVFDPFLGSGTTSKMAKLTGRNYCGVDISEEYCEIARKRTEQAQAQQSLFA